MFKLAFVIFSFCLLVNIQANGLKVNNFNPQKSAERLRKMGNTIMNTADRAQYIKELYYSVNGYPATYDTTNLADPHLDLFNNILGANGVGGILFGAGYETCDAIPTSGSASGSAGPRVGTLNLNFATGTQTIPSYYQTDASTTMDKRINVSGQVAVSIELKCHANSAVQTGYVRLDYSQFNIVYEGFYQKNSTTGAVNLDIYVKTQAGGGQNILIPTQFSTTDGENYRIYSAYINLDGGGQNYIVAVNGIVNGNGQIAYLNTTDTTGGPVTTAPNNFGSLSNAGGTSVAVECIDVTNETTTTGCSAIPAPGSLVIGGTTSTWTVNSLSAVSL